MLTIDHREKALCDALNGTIQFDIKNLPLGDIVCKYDDGTTWIAERKTTQDLGNSIKLGRWSEQSARLNDAGCKIFFLIEGDLRNDAIRMPYNALLSAILYAEMRKNTHVIRTIDVNESACVIRHLCQKCEHPIGVPSGIHTTMTKKRKRDSDPRLVFMRQLICIPTISENVAKKLHEKFGNLTQLQEALRDKINFPKIVLDDKRALGKKRIETLCKYLL